MPSPSSFGGLRVRKSVEPRTDQIPIIDTIKKEDYEWVERKKKPFADFMRPELQHLNEPVRRDYLK